MLNWTKLFSGRFLSTIGIVGSYCFIVVFTTVKYANSLGSSPEKLESFAVGLIMGFSGTAAIVIKSYFDRTDRTIQTKENGNV